MARSAARPFAALSERGQARRLRAVAVVALAAYALEPRGMRLVTNHLNAIFRVDTADGGRYALRLSHPTWRTAADLQTEIAWLAALARDTDLGVPAPVAARSGDLVVTAGAPGVPAPRRAVLFTWVPGVDLVQRLTEANLIKLGALAARLHAHAAGWTPAPGIPARRMDNIYARGEPDALFDPARADENFTPESRALFARMREQVQGAFARRYADPAGLRIIHNDLHQENVKVFRGRLRPLDFEDAIWGYPVQDIAMTFADLLFYTETSPAEYEALKRAFRQGYARVAPWPEAAPGEIETFLAGRQLWRANYVARFQRPHAREFNTRMAARFAAFLETGVFAKDEGRRNRPQ